MFLNTIAATIIAFNQVGICSWYAFPQNVGKHIAASNTYTAGTRLLVTNLANKKSVKVTVVGGGGFTRLGRVLDLNDDPFMHIANLTTGLIRVGITVLER